jgi:Tol biopolymer transport system component
VTDFPGAPYPYGGPFWSPDGDRLIIRMEEEGPPPAGYIFGVAADGSNLVNLSQASGSRGDAMPAWSPDGTEIAYSAIKSGDAFNQLYVMNADGTAPRKLIETEFEVQYPSWSTTGWVAFAGVVDGGFDIYSVRADGSKLTQLTTDPSPDNWPTWSPDGSRIAFFTSRDGKEGIWVMNADGSDQHFLTEGGEPNWSPHGDEIVFDCGGPEKAIICAVHPDGSAPVRLFEEAGFPAVRP